MIFRGIACDIYTTGDSSNRTSQAVVITVDHKSLQVCFPFCRCSTEALNLYQSSLVMSSPTGDHP